MGDILPISWETLVLSFVKLYGFIKDMFGTIFSFFFGSFSDAIGPNWTKVFNDILDGLDSWLITSIYPEAAVSIDFWRGVLNSPFIVVLFGTGLTFYIIYSLIKWVLGIIF